MKGTLIILLFSIAGCKPTTTESRIRHAIENNIRKQHSDIESLEVDSIHYTLGSLTSFYQNLAILENDYLREQSELRQGTIEYGNHSLRVKLSHDINFTAAKSALFGKLSENPDTSIKIYEVKFNLNFKSPKYSNQGKETIYLYANSLTPVRIELDSLLTVNNVQEDKYDSTGEIKALQINDSLELESSKLQRELGLLRARGSHRGVILEKEVQIARLRVLISGNKMKYYWLY